MTTNEPLPDTWATRDLPVLRAFALLAEDQPVGPIEVRRVAERAGVEKSDAEKACLALNAGGYIEHADGDFGSICSDVRGLTARGRRAVGLWPTPETGLDRMVAALDAIAANTDDEDTRTRVEKTRDFLTGAGKHVGLAMATAIATGQLPGQ